METKSVDADRIFKVFTACPDDITTLLLDVRPNKEFKKKHINQAFNVRLSTNGRVLADYSQSSYRIAWSQDCW
jgi:dual specificity MAP kinase phosphatase